MTHPHSRKYCFNFELISAQLLVVQMKLEVRQRVTVAELSELICSLFKSVLKYLLTNEGTINFEQSNFIRNVMAFF